MNEKEVIAEGKLNEIVTVLTHRKNKTVRIQQNFDFCPTLAEQHSARDTDLNYLIKRFKPDELAAYIAARNQVRPEITGHDFSQEPNLQGARNIIYKLKKSFEELPEEVRMNFRNHVEFLKFIDNPANQEKMLKLGLMTKKEIMSNTTQTTTTTKEEKESKETAKESSSKSEKKESANT